jgi:hypothetical protein
VLAGLDVYLAFEHPWGLLVQGQEERSGGLRRRGKPAKPLLLLPTYQTCDVGDCRETGDSLLRLSVEHLDKRVSRRDNECML